MGRQHRGFLCHLSQFYVEKLQMLNVKFFGTMIATSKNISIQVCKVVGQNLLLLCFVYVEGHLFFSFANI